MKYVIQLLVLIGAPLMLRADPLDLKGADIVFLGEVHDNPAHHQKQADWVAEIAPKALVFEMLTPDQAAHHVPDGSEAELAAAFDWSTSGWPDFSWYYPIFAAAPQAQVFGAGVPRSEARRVAQDGVRAVFGAEAELYGLSARLPTAEQSRREALQMAAHCDALPASMLPMMVDIQRLRDAELARVTLRAFDLTGGPVAVITGNGHARLDWGAPSYVVRINPKARVISIGQGEADMPAPQGGFDLIENSPVPERGDPCAAFK